MEAGPGGSGGRGAGRVESRGAPAREGRVVEREPLLGAGGDDGAGAGGRRRRRVVAAAQVRTLLQRRQRRRLRVEAGPFRVVAGARRAAPQQEGTGGRRRAVLVPLGHVQPLQRALHPQLVLGQLALAHLAQLILWRLRTQKNTS